jgi:hypothetical protein
MYNVADLVAALLKMPQDLPVAYKCTENNLEGKIDPQKVEVVPADFGQMVLIS